jgi:tetratricopeptide (TPR) repeat protein
MNADAQNISDSAGGDEETYRLSTELISLGELRAAVDIMRRAVNRARRTLPGNSLMQLWLLSQYAGILELTETFGEAEYIRAKSVEIVESGHVCAEDAVDAFLKYGLLLARNRNYKAAIRKLKEAIRRAQDLDAVSALEQQIVIAKAWKGLQQAYEGLGELSEASEALDRSRHYPLRRLCYRPGMSSTHTTILRCW